MCRLWQKIEAPKCDEVANDRRQAKTKQRHWKVPKEWREDADAKIDAKCSHKSAVRIRRADEER